MEADIRSVSGMLSRGKGGYLMREFNKSCLGCSAIQKQIASRPVQTRPVQTSQSNRLVSARMTFDKSKKLERPYISVYPINSPRLDRETKTCEITSDPI